MRLSNIRFAAKLGILVALGLSGLTILSVATYWVERKAEDALTRLSGTELELLLGFSNIYGYGLQTEQSTRNLMLNPADSVAKDNYGVAQAKFLQTVERLTPIVHPAMKERLEQVCRLWSQDDDLKMEVRRLSDSGHRDQAIQLLMSQETPLWRTMRGVMLDLEDEQARVFAQFEAQAIRDLRFQRTLSILVALLVAIGFLSLTVPIARSTSRRLGALAQVALEIAQGDLRREAAVEGSDEVSTLSQCFQGMVQRLRKIVSTLQTTARELTEASAGLTRDARAQASMLERHASSVTETSTTTRELDQAASVAATRATSVLQIAKLVTQTSEAGQATAARSSEELTRIQGSVEGIVGEALQLLDQTRQMGDIVDTVSELAKQLHVLSLNASIEASRAGEVGRGFAVVAMEIRTLAERSGEGVGRIAAIVQRIMKAVETLRDMTERGSSAMAGSLTQIRASGESLREIGGIVRQTSDAALQIATAVQQQSTGIGQIALAMRDLDSGMQDATGRVHSLEQSAHLVAETADRISAIAGEFRVADGTTSPPPPLPEPLAPIPLVPTAS